MEGTGKDMDNSLTSKLASIQIDNKGRVKSKFSVNDYAIAFVYGMGVEQRERFKKMLDIGCECGKSIAELYRLEYNPFINEVKRLLNVEVN